LLLALSPLDQAGLAAQESEKDQTTIGGYGEVHYSNASGKDTPGLIDLARFVVYVGHQFNDKLSFHSEIEIEDAKTEGSEPGGEVAVEQAFIDYYLSPAFTFRTGLLLIPVGIVNEKHEPPSFNGVNRPDFDHDILPTTWRELGLGAAGRLGGGLAYRVYLLNGIKAEGFSAGEGIYEGHQEGQNASFANPSLTGRLEWGRPGLKLGGSFWYGGSANQDPGIGTGTFAAPVTLVAADGQYDLGAFSFRGEAALINIGDAKKINAVFGNAVGSRLGGGYLEGAANLLHWFAPTATQRLNLFVRHEHYDTQLDVPSGTVDDHNLARRITTLGLNYKPIWNVAFKADYQLRRNQAGVGQDQVVWLGAGYQF
jgi:hypothetical protein